MAIIATGQATITDYNDIQAIVLTRDFILIPVEADGSGGVFAVTNEVTAKVMLGVVDDTENWVFAVAKVGVTTAEATTSDKQTVTGITATAGTITYTATRAGYTTLVKICSVQKVPKGLAASDTTYDQSTDPFPIHPEFTRASNAYKLDGSIVTTGNPRMEQGKFGQAIMVEEGTINILTEPNLFSGATWYRAGTITNTTSKGANGNTATLFTSDRSDGYISYTIAGLTAGLTYTFSVWIAPSNITQLRATNLAYIPLAITTVPILTSVSRYSVTATVPNDGAGTGTLRFYMGSGGTLPAGKTIIVENAQLEQKSYATSFVVGSRALETLTVPTTALSSTEGSISWWTYITPMVKKYNTARNYQVLLYIEGSVTSSCLVLDHFDANSNWRLLGHDGTNLTSQTIPDSTTPDNTWCHFAITYSATVAPKLYINGVLVSTLASNYKPSTLARICIGYAPSNNRQLNGLFDDLKISNIARTATEVLSDYNSGVPAVRDANTTLLLPFDANATWIDRTEVPKTTRVYDGVKWNIAATEGATAAQVLQLTTLETQVDYKLSVYVQAATLLPVWTDLNSNHTGDMWFKTDVTEKKWYKYNGTTWVLTDSSVFDANALAAGKTTYLYETGTTSPNTANGALNDFCIYKHSTTGVVSTYKKTGATAWTLVSSFADGATKNAFSVITGLATVPTGGSIGDVCFNSTTGKLYTCPTTAGTWVLSSSTNRFTTVANSVPTATVPFNPPYVGDTVYDTTSLIYYTYNTAWIASATYGATASQVNELEAATAALTAIASDSILSKGEKPLVVKEWDAINGNGSTTGTHWQITAAAIARSLTFAALTTARANLLAYLTSVAFTAVTTDTTLLTTAPFLTGPDSFKGFFTAYYSEYAALQKLIIDKAATQADWDTVAGTGKPSNGATTGGVNLLRNSDFVDGLSGWIVSNYATDGGNGAIASGVNPTPSFTIQGCGLAYLNHAGLQSLTGTHYMGFEYTDRIPVVPGQIMEIQALVNNHRTAYGYVYMAFFNSAGTILTNSTAYVNAVNLTSDVTSLAHLGLSYGFVPVPANAAYGVFYIRTVLTSGVSYPHLFMTHAYCGVATTGQTAPSPWSYGRSISAITPSNVGTYIQNLSVNTLQIAGEAVTLPRGMNQSGTLTTEGEAVNCSITVGPDVPVIIIASIETTSGVSVNFPGGIVHLMRNGVSIKTSVMHNTFYLYGSYQWQWLNDKTCFTFKDIPRPSPTTGEASYTYSLYVIFTNTPGGISVNNASITLLGAKK